MRILFISITLLLLSNNLLCGQSPPRDFNFIFKFDNKSQLNTFNNTYTKDMVIDNPITIKLKLTKSEKKQIYQSILKSNFFSINESNEADKNIYELNQVYESSICTLEVKCNQIIKILSWNSSKLSPNENKQLNILYEEIITVLNKNSKIQKLKKVRTKYM